MTITTSTLDGDNARAAENRAATDLSGLAHTLRDTLDLTALQTAINGNTNLDNYTAIWRMLQELHFRLLKLENLDF